MLKKILAILFMLMLSIPIVYSGTYWGADVETEMMEDVQEDVSKNLNNIIEEEHRVFEYISITPHYFPDCFVVETGNNYYHTNEWMYKFIHAKEFFQPPSC
jgi:hypothetical protein